jgi:tripartite ATP-independent transporter DctM subunit
MIDLSPVTVLLLMLGGLLFALATGVPVVFALGGVAVIALLLIQGPEGMTFVVVANTYDVMTAYSLICVSLFVLMAMILRYSGIIDDLFVAGRLWLAPIPGGLSMAVVVICVFIGAMSGIIGTGILVLGIVAVPHMLKMGYSKEMAMGPVLAGGALADLIPPSAGFIIYGCLAQVSIGQLFMGGLVPGLLLAGLFMIYVAGRCLFKPELGPPLPREQRVGWRKKFTSLKSLGLPLVIIFACLGTIFLGIASATEASALGAAGALVASAIKRNLRWAVVKEAVVETAKITGMVIWILVSAFCFKSVFILSGGPQTVTGFVATLNLPALAVVGLMMVANLFLGCFLSETTVMLISVPVFLPVVDALEFSRLWFGVCVLVSLQVGALSPPFGFALFYMRSVAPKGITMADIIRSILPFIPIQLVCLTLVLVFPVLATWLPSQMFTAT